MNTDKHRLHLLGVWLLGLFVLGCGSEAPTGITVSDIEGVWRGRLDGVTLMGRSLSGDVDWQFETRTFELRFFNPPPDQAERISGGWKFSGGKMVLTLRSSFPIGDDIGVTDTLFVSILGDELSMKTFGGSDILLRKTGFTLRLEVGFPEGIRLCDVSERSGITRDAGNRNRRVLPISAVSRPSADDLLSGLWTGPSTPGPIRRL